MPLRGHVFYDGPVYMLLLSFLILINIVLMSYIFLSIEFDVFRQKFINNFYVKGRFTEDGSFIGQYVPGNVKEMGISAALQGTNNNAMGTYV